MKADVSKAKETPKQDSFCTPRNTRSTTQNQKLSSVKQREYWKEKQRQRRSQLTEEQKEEVRKKSRARYASKKQAFQKNKNNTNIVADVSAQTDKSDFTKSPTKAAKYNALHRVKKAMPKKRKTIVHILLQLIKKATPTKKQMLTEVLSSELSLGQPTSTKIVRKRQTRDSITKINIIKFFEENSVHLPGQNYFSKRLNKQKSILTHPISFLYKKFLEVNKGTKVSIRTFFRCKPRHIMSMKCQKYVQCLCECCENARLKLIALKTCGIKMENVREALAVTLCDTSGGWWRPECVSRKCNHCGVHLLKEKLMNQCDTGVSLTFKEWRMIFNEKYKVNRMEFTHQTMPVLNVIEKLVDSVKDLSLHTFTFEWQRKQFNDVRKNLPLNTAVIVLDYAENYTCKHQREVSAVHWSYNQVTLLPVVSYERCHECNDKVTSYHLFISDDLLHDSNVAFHALKKVLSESQASKFVIFSDNCGVQFKSKLPFHHMSLLANEFCFERCYFGERHGKNECDSFGGMVKSYLSQAVASGRAVLQNAHDIVSFLNCNMSLTNMQCSHPKRTFSLIKDASVDRSISSSHLKTLSGTKKIHSLKVLNSQTLAVRQFSCFCHFCFLGLYDDCLNKQVIGGFNHVKWPNAKNDDAHNLLDETDVPPSRISEDDGSRGNALTLTECNPYPIVLCQDAVAAEKITHDDDVIKEVVGQNCTVHENINSDGHGGVIADSLSAGDENYFNDDFRGECESSASKNANNDVTADVMGETQGYCEKNVNTDDVSEDEDDEFVMGANQIEDDGSIESAHTNDDDKCQSDGNEHAKDDQHDDLKSESQGDCEKNISTDYYEEGLNCDNDDDLIDECHGDAYIFNEETQHDDVNKVANDDVINYMGQGGDNRGHACVDTNDGICFSENDSSRAVKSNIQVGIKVVRRKLFAAERMGRKEYFKDLYSKMLSCMSFDEIKCLCENISDTFKHFELTLLHPTISRREVDRTALQLLPPNKPSGYLPALTLGDGNCMTRSFSKIVFGHENNHLEMRCRIIAELCLNKDLYLDENFMSIGCMLEKEKILPLIALLSDCHDGSDTRSPQVIEETFKKEILNARRSGQSLGMWQLVAASKVLNCAIISLYPRKGPKNVQTLFGRAILPDGYKHDYSESFYIMWSSTRQMSRSHWVANHVVPMLKCHM